MTADDTDGPGARECPWCGDPMPPPKGTGRPRTTCGKDRCRRRSGAARAVEQQHEQQLAALRAEVVDARQESAEAVQAHRDYVDRTVDALANLDTALRRAFDEARRVAPAGPERLANHLVNVVRETLPALVRTATERARSERSALDAYLAERSL